MARFLVLLGLLGLIGCAGDSGTETDSGSSSGISAPEMGTDPDGTARTGDDVSAVIVTPSEGGTGEMTYEYRWLSGGETWTTDVLPSTVTAKGETWTVTVTPYAGDTSGPSAETTIDIVNTPPSLVGAEFTPLVPTLGQDLLCSPIGPEDADDDAMTFTYAWTRDGSPLSETSNTLGSADLTVGAEIICSLTVHDDESTGNTATASGTALNSPPTSTGSTISPTTMISTEDLTCAGVGGADVDNDPVTWAYEWTVNGTVVTGETGATLSESFYIHDDEVVCTALPFDGASYGDGVASATVTVGNAPPVVTAANPDPLAPLADEGITCIATATEPDSEQINWTYEWYVANTLVSETSGTLLGGFSAGDEVYCRATASDGELSDSLDSDVAVVANTLPTISGVALAPTTAYANEAITCSHTSTDDVDFRQTVDVTYAWTWGTAGTYTGATLPADSASTGDTAICTATPNDGVANGTPGTAQITFDNELPPTPTVAISPQTNIYYDTALTCSASPTQGADGDNITYTYTWTVGGNAAGTGETFTGTASSGDVVECSAVGTDGFTNSSPGTDSVTILNTPPPTPTVTLDVSSATTATSITCNATPATDDEGEAITYTYEWFVGGSSVGTGATLAPFTVPGPATVTCEATGSDGGTQTSQGTTSIAIDNTDPTATAGFRSGTAQAQADDVICDVNTTDADNHTVSATVEWQFEDYTGTWVSWAVGVENSGAANVTNDQINPSDTVAGRRFRCRADADDGNGGSYATAWSAAISISSPPGCAAEYSSVGAESGPLSMHGACWYAGAVNTSCDVVCDNAGQFNVGITMANAWPDSCDTNAGPSDQDPSKWFVDHGNALGSYDPRAYNNAGLGYNWRNVDYAGKCPVTLPSLAGSFPGESSSFSGGSSMCACGNDPVPWTPLLPGNSQTTYTNAVLTTIVNVESETWIEGYGVDLSVNTAAGNCNVDWYIHTNVEGDLDGPWVRADSGQIGATNGWRLYESPTRTRRFAAGTTVAFTAASNCNAIHYYFSHSGGQAIAGGMTSAGWCYNTSGYTGYSTGWVPSDNCSLFSNQWQKKLKIAP